MNTHSIRLITIMTSLACLTLFSGCAMVGMMMSESKTFFVEGTYSLEGVTKDPLTMAQQAGQLLEMNIASIDRTNGSLTLDFTSSLATNFLVGKESSNKIEVRLNRETNSLDFNVTVQGNFDTGTQEAAQALMNKFIEKLNGLKG